jgi:hypothetical protein
MLDRVQSTENSGPNWSLTFDWGTYSNGHGMIRDPTTNKIRHNIPPSSFSPELNGNSERRPSDINVTGLEQTHQTLNDNHTIQRNGRSEKVATDSGNEIRNPVVRTQHPNQTRDSHISIDDHVT